LWPKSIQFLHTTFRTGTENEELPLNIRLVKAYQDWLASYPFTIFCTFTWPTGGGRVKSIPAWASKQLTEFLRESSKRFRVTLGAMGFITLGHSWHLHSHLLVLEKKGQTLTGDQMTLMELDWPHQAKVEPVDRLAGVAGYVASWKHLVRDSAMEPVFYSYGSKTLGSTTCSRSYFASSNL
jgi:hypothetical protein